MSRFCEICGAPIGDLAGICQSCGVAHSALNAEDGIMLGQPRWGVIRVELSVQTSEAGSATAALRAAWSLLEEGSFQKLAPSQLHLITSELTEVELVGAYSSFVKLQEALEGKFSFRFLDKSPSEIDNLLARVSMPRKVDGL